MGHNTALFETTVILGVTCISLKRWFDFSGHMYIYTRRFVRCLTFGRMTPDWALALWKAPCKVIRVSAHKGWQMNHEAAGMSRLREVYSAITELTGRRVSAVQGLARAGRMEDPSPPLVPLPPPPQAVVFILTAFGMHLLLL